jgi:hypothetical protein
MIGAHLPATYRVPARPVKTGSTPVKPRVYDEGIVLTRGQLAKIAKHLGEIERAGFMKCDGMTIKMAQAGPFRDLLRIFATAGA